MPRPSIHVDKGIFEQAVKGADLLGGFKTQKDFYIAVANNYNTLKGETLPEISFSVAMLRIQAWNIQTGEYAAFRKNVNKEELPKQSEKITETHSSPKPFINLRGIIHTPAGEPPYKLLDDDETSLREWVNKIVDDGGKKQYTYSANALWYWARNYCPKLQNAEWSHILSIRDTIERIMQ